MNFFERIKTRWLLFKTVRKIKSKYKKASRLCFKIDGQIEELKQIIELDKKIIDIEEVLK